MSKVVGVKISSSKLMRDGDDERKIGEGGKESGKGIAKGESGACTGDDDRETDTLFPSLS